MIIHSLGHSQSRQNHQNHFFRFPNFAWFSRIAIPRVVKTTFGFRKFGFRKNKRGLFRKLKAFGFRKGPLLFFPSKPPFPSYTSYKYATRKNVFFSLGIYLGHLQQRGFCGFCFSVRQNPKTATPLVVVLVHQLLSYLN